MFIAPTRRPELRDAENGKTTVGIWEALPRHLRVTHYGEAIKALDVRLSSFSVDCRGHDRRR